MEKVVWSWSQDLETTDVSFALPPKSLLFYTPLPLSATDVEGGGCMTRVHGRGGEMMGSGQNKWNCSTVNLFDRLLGGCILVIHGGGRRHWAKNQVPTSLCN